VKQSFLKKKVELDRLNVAVSFKSSTGDRP